MPKVTKVIVPVAGQGTRFLPATKAQPKEMLPIIDKPVIQFLVEEATASGISDIIFVTGRSKRAIEDHFDSAPELEASLEKNGKDAALKLVRDISGLAQFAYVRQNTPKGDGDALLSASHLAENEPVGVMFGDDIVSAATPALKQLIDVYEQFGESVVALERVPRDQVSAYGVVAADEVSPGVFKISDIVEKPKMEEAPSDLIIVGKYVITPRVFLELRKLEEKGTEGELRLSNALREVARTGTVYGVLLDGKRYDCGSKIGYLRATVDMALGHPEVKDEFREYLKEVAKTL